MLENLLRSLSKKGSGEGGTVIFYVSTIGAQTVCYPNTSKSLGR